MNPIDKKLREILENLCDEDDENVRCTMIDLALAEIKKVWGEMIPEKKHIIKHEEYMSEGQIYGWNACIAELRQNLTQPPNESEVRR